MEIRSSWRRRFLFRVRRLRRQWERHGSAFRWGATLTAMVLVLVAVGSWRWFVRPTIDQPESADAVVLFVGGRGERLDVALDLLGDGVGSALVLPNGNIEGWQAAIELCSQPQSFDVYCFTPDPDDTWGEARGIGALADANGWDELVAVTSTYHVTRVRTLLDRCTSADVAVVGVSPGLSILDWTVRIGHEWLGSTAAQTIRRSC